MTSSDRERATLRDALRLADAEAAPSDEAPAPEHLWAAVHGRLPRRDTEAVVDAALHDPAATEELRIALALQDALDEEHSAPERGVQPRWGRAPWIAAAVACAAAALLLLVRPSPPPPEVPSDAYRGTGQTLASEVEASELPAEAFALAWESRPDARYDLRVSTDAPRLLLRKRGLTAPRYTIPPETFEGLPSGTRILWQVEAVLPDNSRERSATFVVQLR